MSSELAIEVESLGKAYQIYRAPQDRLKQALVPRLQRAAAPLTKLAGHTIVPANYCQAFWALRDVDFRVQRGETVGIIGLNGSGKSTLLQLICGTLTPTTGRATVQGRVAAILELGSGFNPEFTGRENVYLNGIVLGLTREQITGRFDDIAAFADIGEFIEQPIKTYSSGMAMRLAFAVVANVDADVLIIDEALAVGDAFFQQKCLRWLRNFRQRGTVLFCSHDTGSVINLCQQAVWLDHGRARAIGPAKEVCEAYLATMYAQATGLADDSVKLAERQAISAAEEANGGNLGQHLQVMEFNEQSGFFGSGEASITNVDFLDEHGTVPTFLTGGEVVQIVMHVVANAAIDNPIVGFLVKDRLGQALFGDNTYERYRHQQVHVAPGEQFEARFAFKLPLLRTGVYSITAAIASGTMENHVQLHWLHDAKIFTVNSPYRNGVMMAIPMLVNTIDRRN